MDKLIDIISSELKKAFEKCGYNSDYGQVTVSNRPDLCQYQCNGGLAAAKVYKKAPIQIAGEVLEAVENKEIFSKLEAVMPGFINISLSSEFLSDYLQKMSEDELLGVQKVVNPKTIVIDYGGPNVAKPLHVGHLRSAVIGESVKRILKYVGNNVIGDAHLGDWGLQIGLIITELKKRQPELPYFDENYEGEYPEEPPFTMGELEEIYPYANNYSKTDEAYKEEARHATFLLQNGHAGYRALWKHIMEVSVADLKKNYEKLNVHFDLWKKESDAQPYIPDMVQGMKDGGFAYISDGALVVDVKEETDTKEMPPCMILKSDGATLYNTTDLATIVERMKLFNPDRIIYLTDQRQSLYFEQVFRCARKTGLVKPETELTFLGFGTMNGKDGKPFKTRDGGVMRLEYLIKDITEEVYGKMSERDMSEEEARKIAAMVGLSAIKYGDLSNQPSKDYIFDIDRFTSFEGNTGPYILYTMVRIKSILSKCGEVKAVINGTSYEPSAEETALRLQAARFNDMIEHAAAELAPNKICQYIYELSNAFNSFYHGNRILAETDETKKASWIALITLTLRILENGIDLLAFEAPDRM
ncbi:MAG: arginine--tRNA ligase [Lachnospiraceae bacterium]|nr:arginine--tRNA ligase [Lachnospiraceae bacterium]